MTNITKVSAVSKFLMTGILPTLFTFHSSLNNILEKPIFNNNKTNTKKAYGDNWIKIF